MKNKIFLTSVVLSFILYCVLFIFDPKFSDDDSSELAFGHENIDTSCIVKNQKDIFNFAEKCSKYSNIKEKCFEQAKYFYCKKK